MVFPEQLENKRRSWEQTVINHIHKKPKEIMHYGRPHENSISIGKGCRQNILSYSLTIKPVQSKFPSLPFPNWSNYAALPPAVGLIPKTFCLSRLNVHTERSCTVFFDIQHSDKTSKELTASTVKHVKCFVRRGPRTRTKLVHTSVFTQLLMENW